MAREAKTAPAEEPAPSVEAVDVDRVAMVSLRADGTPDQTPGYEVLAAGEPETEA